MEKTKLLYMDSEGIRGTAKSSKRYDIMMFNRTHTFITEEELNLFNQYHSYSFVNTRRIFIQPVLSIFMNLNPGYINLSLN